MSPGKVYVIHPTTPRERTSRPPEPKPRRAPGNAPGVSPPHRGLLAYLTGPVALVLWSEGLLRLVAGFVSLTTLALGVILLTSFSQVSGWFAGLSHSVTLWLLLVPGALMTLVTLWCLAVAVSGRSAAVATTWMRRPWSILLSGMLVPGLGLYLAGHARRAAAALWIVGPLATSAILLARWRWFWDITQTNSSPGVAGRDLETLFVVAGVVAVSGALLWIVQALDGVRLVSRGQSRASSNAFSVLLILVLIYAAAAFQPAALAEDLYHSSVMLRGAGMQLVPLVLCDAATRLDPVVPAYIADAAALNEALGMAEAAQAKRARLLDRALVYNATLVTADPAAAKLLITGLNGALDSIGSNASSARRVPLDNEDCLPLMTARHIR